GGGRELRQAATDQFLAGHDDLAYRATDVPGEVPQAGVPVEPAPEMQGGEGQRHRLVRVAVASHVVHERVTMRRRTGCAVRARYGARTSGGDGQDRVGVDVDLDVAVHRA